MRFNKTKYHLQNVCDGHEFEDRGWTLADPECKSPSLIRAVYENKAFTPHPEYDGIYRYAEWMPIKRLLKKSCAPVTYKSKGMGKFLGLDNLYITFSGWNPKLGAKFRTCSFKETEAYSVLARLDADEKRILVVQSAGNTAGLSPRCARTTRFLSSSVFPTTTCTTSGSGRSLTNASSS